MSESYTDFIDLERPLLRFHALMSRMQCAAQFVLFAAWIGYDEEILPMDDILKPKSGIEPTSEEP